MAATELSKTLVRTLPRHPSPALEAAAIGATKEIMDINKTVIASYQHHLHLSVSFKGLTMGLAMATGLAIWFYGGCDVVRDIARAAFGRTADVVQEPAEDH